MSETAKRKVQLHLWRWARCVIAFLRSRWLLSKPLMALCSNEPPRPPVKALLALATEYLSTAKSLELHSLAVLPLAFMSKVKGPAAAASSRIDHFNP